MFKKSTTNHQVDFLGNISSNLDAKRAEVINDPEAWFNQFYEHVVCRFDESSFEVLSKFFRSSFEVLSKFFRSSFEVLSKFFRSSFEVLSKFFRSSFEVLSKFFRSSFEVLSKFFRSSFEVLSKFFRSSFEVLYSRSMGRTNAPIRTLLAMMALKEGFGWSDKQLYEHTAPVLSTYYLFKQSVYRYHIEQGRDLIEEAFRALTKSQAEFFDVDGQKIRMDSKLIGSNIVRCSRLQLIISCLQSFWKSLPNDLQSRLDNERRETLDELCKKNRIKSSILCPKKRKRKN